MTEMNHNENFLLSGFNIKLVTISWSRIICGRITLENKTFSEINMFYLSIYNHLYKIRKKLYNYIFKSLCNVIKSTK